MYQPVNRIVLIISFTFFWWTSISASADPVRNGFDLAGSLIPANEVLSGGPPRDGIPSIDNPEFITASEADFLNGQDWILGISRNGITRAYPISILNWHEVVNDRFGEEAIAVTFCPLCGTGVAFKADISGKARSFGVSGLLYNSDVLLYDRESESLWSQLKRQAVTGTMIGSRLDIIPVSHTRWIDWQIRYPDTQVLSTKTGAQRDYKRDPYSGYEKSETVYFPVSANDKRFHPKERVIGLEIDGKFKAYAYSELAKTAASFSESFANQELKIEFSAEHGSGRVINAEGAEIPTIVSFWFAWFAFHPETEVFKAP